jgi:hypothetical protein
MSLSPNLDLPQGNFLSGKKERKKEREKERERERGGKLQAVNSGNKFN